MRTETFFDPDRAGFIDTDGWEYSSEAGGHEVGGAVLERVVRVGERIGPEQTVLALPNSWGTSWGDGGWFRTRRSTYQAPRSQTDVYQFRLTA
ncbi:C1 family peptidase [Streptomyces sp. JW3]|uniref:C1 family peptidase n=1 Tax=Streptomyces sp. JW3 TaxID=3456955 RepID=UPI003FA4519C